MYYILKTLETSHIYPICYCTSPGQYDLTGKFLSGSNPRKSAFPKGGFIRDKSQLTPGPGSYKPMESMGKQVLSTCETALILKFSQAARPSMVPPGTIQLMRFTIADASEHVWLHANVCSAIWCCRHFGHRTGRLQAAARRVRPAGGQQKAHLRQLQVRRGLQERRRTQEVRPQRAVTGVSLLSWHGIPHPSSLIPHLNLLPCVMHARERRPGSYTLPGGIATQAKGSPFRNSPAATLSGRGKFGSPFG